MSNCPYACRLWPTSLYCGSEDSCISDDSAPIEGCAVTTKIVMQGIVLRACAELGCPIVVLEEIAEECKEHPKNKAQGWDVRDAFFRLESSVFYERSNSVCRALREQTCDKADCPCKGGQSTLCFAFDARMAQYLLDHVDKIRNADEKELQTIHTVSLDPVAEDPKFPSETQAKWFYIKDKKVIGIRYHCPMSGYSEFAFLLEIENIRAVMIMGQILFKDEKDKDNVLQQKKQVEEKLCEQATAQYNKKADIPNFGDFIAEVVNVNLEESFAKNLTAKDLKTEKFISEEVFLHNAATVINNQMKKQLELRMDERYAAMRSIIINDGINAFTKGIEARFWKEFPDEFDFLPPDRVNDLYKMVCEVFCDVMETDESTGGINLKDYMGITVRKENICINPEGFRASVSEKSAYFKQGFKFIGESRLKYQLSGELFGKELPQITFSDVEYSDSNIREVKIQKELQVVFDAIYNRFSLVAEELRATYLMLYNKAFTASMRHELGQAHQGMLLDMKNYGARIDLNLRALEQWEPVDLERRRSLVKDVRHMQYDFGQYLHESVLRVNSTRYIDLIPEPIIVFFLPYEAFLYKWSHIYRRRAEEGMVDFEMMRVEFRDARRPHMYADKDMMEQVAYNLTNNAFKYSRPGTQICLDCKLSEDGQWYELGVTNYGVKVDKSEFDRICEYGFRGSNHDGNDGNGLGLWHCNEIAKKHRGHLILNSVSVSEYDITAFLLYWLMDKDGQDEVAEYLDEYPMVLRKNLSEERLRLKKECAEHWKTFNERLPKVNRFTPLYVASMLNRGTAKFSFTVQIPSKQAISIEGSNTDE